MRRLSADRHARTCGPRLSLQAFSSRVAIEGGVRDVDHHATGGEAVACGVRAPPADRDTGDQCPARGRGRAGDLARGRSGRVGEAPGRPSGRRPRALPGLRRGLSTGLPDLAVLHRRRRTARSARPGLRGEAVSFGWHGRARRVVVTAFADDRRILQQWDLDLRSGHQLLIPAGTRAVRVDDPATITRTRVELGRSPLPRSALRWQR